MLRRSNQLPQSAENDENYDFTSNHPWDRQPAIRKYNGNTIETYRKFNFSTMFQGPELFSELNTRLAHSGQLSIGIVLARNRYSDYCSQNPYVIHFSRSFKLSPHDPTTVESATCTGMNSPDTRGVGVKTDFL